MKYIDILNDEIIIEKYKEIDSKNNYYMSHGLKHVMNVFNTCITLSYVLNIKDIDNLLIAALLHDIGKSVSEGNHAVEGSRFAQKYLSGKMKEEDISMISNMIENHSSSLYKENLTLLEEVLRFADKMDITYKRLEDSSTESCLEHLLDIVYTVSENKFIVKLISDGSLKKEDFFKEKPKYRDGLPFTVSLLANKLNMGLIIYFDNELFYETSDPQKYIGEFLCQHHI